MAKTPSYMFINKESDKTSSCPKKSNFLSSLFGKARKRVTGTSSKSAAPQELSQAQDSHKSPSEPDAGLKPNPMSSSTESHLTKVKPTSYFNNLLKKQINYCECPACQKRCVFNTSEGSISCDCGESFFLETEEEVVTREEEPIVEFPLTKVTGGIKWVHEPSVSRQVDTVAGEELNKGDIVTIRADGLAYRADTTTTNLVGCSLEDKKTGEKITLAWMS